MKNSNLAGRQAAIKSPFPCTFGGRLLLLAIAANTFGCASMSQQPGTYTAARSVHLGSNIPQPSSAAGTSDRMATGDMESSSEGQDAGALHSNISGSR